MSAFQATGHEYCENSDLKPVNGVLCSACLKRFYATTGFIPLFLRCCDVVAIASSALFFGLELLGKLEGEPGSLMLPSLAAFFAAGMLSLALSYRLHPGVWMTVQEQQGVFVP